MAGCAVSARNVSRVRISLISGRKMTDGESGRMNGDEGGLPGGLGVLDV